MFQIHSRIARTVCCAILLLGFAGCNGTDTSETPPSTGSGSSDPSAEVIRSSDTKYGAIIREGEKIGHSIEKVEHLTHHGEALVRTTNTEHLRIQRAGQAMEMQLESVFLETPTGHLRQFVTKVDQAGAITRFQGRVSSDGRSMTVTTQSSASRPPVTETLPWNPGWGGPYAVQRLFQEPPIEAGQTRSAMSFMATLNKASEVRIEGLQKEAVTLLDGATYKLLKVNSVTQIAGEAPLKETVWVDDEGDVVKTMSPIQGFEKYRCPKDYALSENKAVEFDLAIDTVVPVLGMMPDRKQAETAAYLLRLQGSEPAEVFSSQTNQRLERGPTSGSAVLHVYRVQANTPRPPELPADDQPQPDDSSASPLVQFEDPEVQRLALQTRVPSDDAWQKAVALERFVHGFIEQKDFSRGFLSAADVADQKVGDCTEHAVLLMALLRAHRIPARGALGLVYVDHGNQPGFAYHMWTEAWIGDRWIPLDATRGEGGIDIGYIKVTQSSLSGAGAFAAFLPVSQVIGQLQIEVME